MAWPGRSGKGVRQEQVYDLVKLYGPMSMTEAAEKLHEVRDKDAGIPFEGKIKHSIVAQTGKILRSLAGLNKVHDINRGAKGTRPQWAVKLPEPTKNEPRLIERSQPRRTKAKPKPEKTTYQEIRRKADQKKADDKRKAAEKKAAEKDQSWRRYDPTDPANYAQGGRDAPSGNQGNQGNQGGSSGGGQGLWGGGSEGFWGEKK